MDKTTLQKLKDAIAKASSIGIAVGQEPTVDEMGAALSLYLLLTAANKKVSIACSSDPIVEISSLVGIDRVQKQFGGDAGDLVVSFPYEEGEIEKVSYTLENNFLNIIVKASEQGLSFDAKDIRYTRGSGTIDLLISVGSAKLSDLGDIFDEQKLSNVVVINIDNQAENQGFGDIVLVSPQASSLSEHVGDIMLTLGFTLDQDAAQNLMSGIMSATKNFQDPKTSSLAFEISGFLMKRGARRVNTAGPVDHSINAFQPTYEEPVNEPVKEQPQFMPAPEPEQQSAPQPVAPVAPEPVAQQPVVQADEKNDDTPPLDWLTPKVYRGSSEV